MAKDNTDEFTEQPENISTHRSSKKKHATETGKPGQIQGEEINEPKLKKGGEKGLEEKLKVALENESSLQECLKAAEEKNKELHDKYLRLSAEFDNYRKRTLREKSEMVKTASEDLLARIIPVVDDLERGLLVVEQARDTDAVKQGMALIHNRFKEFLLQNGIKEIEALNQEFNTDIHEAVSKVPAPDEQKGKVVDVIEKGYLLHEKVLRFPKVVVGE